MPSVAAISRVVVAAYPFSRKRVAAVSKRRSRVPRLGSAAVSTTGKEALSAFIGRQARIILSLSKLRIQNIEFTNKRPGAGRLARARPLHQRQLHQMIIASS